MTLTDFDRIIIYTTLFFVVSGFIVYIVIVIPIPEYEERYYFEDEITKKDRNILDGGYINGDG